MTETVETLKLIAERVPPSDRWALITDRNTVYPSLIETLNAYHVLATIKPRAYRLEPINGKIYAILESVQEAPQPKKYNLYGDYD